MYDIDSVLERLIERITELEGLMSTVDFRLEEVETMLGQTQILNGASVPCDLDQAEMDASFGLNDVIDDLPPREQHVIGDVESELSDLEEES